MPRKARHKSDIPQKNTEPKFRVLQQGRVIGTSTGIGEIKCFCRLLIGEFIVQARKGEEWRKINV